MDDGELRRARGAHLRRVLTWAGAAVVVVGGCAQPPEPLPAQIECTYQFRPDADRDAGATQDRLLVEQGESAGAEFDAMALQVTYTVGQPDGNGVRVVVSGDAGEPLSEYRYQAGTAAQTLHTEFAGGHGFTGLLTTYDDGARLQFWCSANRAAETP
ncbi:hypothetical protein [Pseudactinotalea sp. Z1748]|uniref:hypothetical protein n=1 Tax=Pseudactinotalea sp. Z1748 TaxID=3413027 RepID=UPI003C7A4D89